MSQLFRNFKTVFFLLLLCCGTGYAQVAPPQTVNFQGRLTDLSDNPLNGSFDITFTLYNAASGGIALWTETQNGVAVDNGSVEALLGSVTPIPYSAATSPAAYLQIQVGAETLSPRQPFASVLYSMNSAQLSGRTYDMFMDLSSPQTVPGVKTFGTIIATNSVTAARFYGNGSNLTGIIGDSLGDHTAIADLNMSGRSIVSVGTVTAYHFVGDGAGLTGISGDNLGSHMASTALDMANFPVNNVSTLTVNNTVMAASFYGDGSMLTGVRGDNLGNHTAAMPLDMSGQDIIAANNVTAANFYGNGAGLTGVTAAGDNLGSHTATTALNMAGFPISNAVSLTVSSNVTAGKYFGDGSALTGIAGDNLGNHTASADLNMSGRNIVSVGTVTANNFVGNGSGLTGISGDNLGSHIATQSLNLNGNSIVSVASISVAGSEFSVGGNAFAVTGGKAGVGTASPYEMLEIETYGKTVVQVDNGGSVGEAKFRLASANVEKGFMVLMPELSEIRFGGGVGMSAAFHANNIEIMRLASGGNVGIGTANPGAKLDVAGNVKIADGTQGAGKVLTSDSAGLASWQPVSGDNLGSHIAGTALDMAYHQVLNVTTMTVVNAVVGGYFVGDGSGLSNLNALPKTGGTLTGALNFGGAVPDITSLADEHITIMPAGSGNVGIGEGNPVAKLTVNGDVRATGNLTIGVSGSTTLSVGSGAGESVITAPDNQTLTLKGTREAGLGNAFQVQTYNAAKSVFTDRFTVTGATDTANIALLNSNVGIGTINPANQFVLAHGAGVMNKVFLDGTIDDGGGVAKRVVSLSNTDGSNYGGYLALGNRYSPLTGPADGATVLLSGAPNQNSYISVGNVGIGTTTPGAKLHVAGSVKIADGTQGAGKVLTSDSSGLASWQPSAGDNLGSHIAGTALDMSGFPISNVENLYVTGTVSAMSFSGDGSGLTGINPPGDNLGNHTAAQDLGMGGFGISSVGNITGSGAVALTAGGIGALDLLAGNTLTPGQTGGAVKIAAGGGYNAPGAGVFVSAGLTSTWSAAGSSAAVVLDGGPSDSPATSAQVKVHGKISSGSGMEYNPGGPVEIIGGNGNAAQGGNIILMPGSGSPAGNVGIGTNSPGTTLHVLSQSNNIATFASPSAVSSVLTIQNDAVTEQRTMINFNSWSSGNSGLRSMGNIGFVPGGHISIETSNNGNTGGERLRITATGDIGIGTANPGAKLEVAGNVKIADGTQGAGKVLTSDSSGLASWQAVSGDNLGNHTATTGLNMAGFPVFNVSSLTMVGGGLSVLIGTSSFANGLFITNTGGLYTQGYGGAGSTYAPAARGTGAVDLQSFRVLGADRVSAGNYSTIAGGIDNKIITGSINGFIGAGDRNTFTSGVQNSVIVGGYNNVMGGSHAFIGGGYGNTANAAYSVVSGGGSNIAESQHTSIMGGYVNSIDAWSAASSIIGGSNNAVIHSDYALAGGFYARSSWASGAFTWADSQGTPLDNTVADRTVFKNRGGFMVTGSTNTFIGGVKDRGVFITGDGLVGISTGSPKAALDVVAASGGYAQIWRDSSGNVVSSMSASGVLYPQSAPAGDNLGNHTATMALQMGPYGVNTSSHVNAGAYQIAGTRVLAVLPGIDSLGVGLGAGQVDTGNNNVFVGYRAGYSNTNGFSNTFLGQNAGYSNTTAYNNTYVGQNVGYFNTTGIMNSMLGTAAGYSNTTGSNNTFMGDYAGNYNQTGSANALFGFGAGGYGAGSVHSFSSSTVVGYKAGYMLGNGSADNTLIGFQAGDSLTTGSRNIVIGYNQDATAPTISNELNIGGIIWGNLQTGAVGLGLTTTLPQAALDVKSTGTAADQMAQVWRNSGGTVVSSVSATGVMTVAKLVSAMGSGTGQASPIGLAGVNLNTQATTGTAEQTLLSYTLPANSLNANSKGVRIKAWGTALANSNTKNMRLRFGGLSGTIVSSQSIVPSGDYWWVDAIIFRTGANTQKGVGNSLNNTIVFTSAQTDTASIDVVVTGETPAATGDVTAEGMMVEFLN